MIGRGPFGRRRQPGTAVHRRSGPVGEQRWWDPEPQAALEALVLPRTLFGRGWTVVPMVNNTERLDPHGSGAASAPVVQARAERGLLALDGGRAWRRRGDQVLAVVRLERFADERRGEVDPAANHRQAWQQHGAASLAETWRTRWTEREVVPGWIEATGITPAHPHLDWFRLEDHTGGAGDVTIYEHLSVWQGRSLAMVTVRHDVGVDLDREIEAAAESVHIVLGG